MTYILDKAVGSPIPSEYATLRNPYDSYSEDTANQFGKGFAFTPGASSAIRTYALYKKKYRESVMAGTWPLFSWYCMHYLNCSHFDD